jgi:hypothetical protein
MGRQLQSGRDTPVAAARTINSSRVTWSLTDGEHVYVLLQRAEDARVGQMVVCSRRRRQYGLDGRASSEERTFDGKFRLQQLGLCRCALDLELQPHQGFLSFFIFPTFF